MKPDDLKRYLEALNAAGTALHVNPPDGYDYQAHRQALFDLTRLVCVLGHGDRVVLDRAVVLSLRELVEVLGFAPSEPADREESVEVRDAIRKHATATTLLALDGALDG